MKPTQSVLIQSLEAEFEITKVRHIPRTLAVLGQVLSPADEDTAISGQVLENLFIDEVVKTRNFICSERTFKHMKDQIKPM